MPRNTERNNKIVEAYNQMLASDSVSYRSLANAFNLKSAQQIKNILMTYGIEPIEGKRGAPRKTRTSISKAHLHLGSIVFQYRNAELEMTREDFAKKTNIPTHVLIKIEQGIYDVTLTQLQSIAKIIGKSVQELVLNG